ncbi:hypothetical protein GCM10009528_23060 [Kineococcus aurantiacus]
MTASPDERAAGEPTNEELTARLLRVAQDPHRPLVYRHEARGLAEGYITFCVRGGNPQAHRRALGERVLYLETHVPTPSELAQLRRSHPEASRDPVFPSPKEVEARRRHWRRMDALRRWAPPGAAAVAGSAIAGWLWQR